MLLQLLLLLLFTSPLILGKPYKSSNRTHARSDDSGCRRMRSSGGIGKRGILCIGQLRADRLLVITRDYQVYQLPMNSLTTAVSKLYINDTKPLPLSVKWPRIASSRRFKAVLPRLYNAFFYVNSEHEFLFLTTKWSRSHQFGATFDVDTQEGWQGLTYYDADDQVLIGSFNRAIFYAINKMGGQLRLLRYLRHCRPGQPPASCNITQTDEPVYDLCKKEGGTNQMVMLPIDHKEPCPRLNWPVLNGFISSDTFYLFGSSYVVTFPESIWARPNEPVAYNSTSYGDFIQCGGSSRERSAQVTRKTPNRLGVIVACSLLGLLLLLCILLCLVRSAVDASTERKSKKGPPGGPKSVRSGGGFTFGLLSGRVSKTTKQQRKSVRSSKMPSAKSLSKKSAVIAGYYGHGKSARSTTPISKPGSLSRKKGSRKSTLASRSSKKAPNSRGSPKSRSRKSQIPHGKK